MTSVTPYGYGTAPGQGGMGYYEQQTPGGSFVGANQQYAQGQAPVGTQYASASGYSNPYMGMQSQGVSGAPSVLGYAQQGQYNNPYLGQMTGGIGAPGQNPYGMGNPYLQQQIDAASQDATRNFQNSVMPGLDRMMQASGSFGNTGVQQQQQQAYSDLGRNLGNISSGMRMQDYTQQQQLAENGLNRGMQADMFNANMRSGDLGRNMAGGFQQQAQNMNPLLQAAMFDSSNNFAGQQFNANAGNQMGMFNANLAQQGGQFNAGAQNAASMFNAGQGNQMGQFNANMGQQLNMFNTGQGNAMNQFNSQAGNSMLENFRNRTQQQGQFDANLDWNIDQGNWNRQRTGQLDQLNMMNTMFGWGQQGIGNANNIQNTPLNYWQQFAGTGMGLGGQGGTGTNSQTMQGDPFLGFMGGWNMAGGLLGNNRYPGNAGHPGYGGGVF